MEFVRAKNSKILIELSFQASIRPIGRNSSWKCQRRDSVDMKKNYSFSCENFVLCAVAENIYWIFRWCLVNIFFLPCKNVKLCGTFAVFFLPNRIEHNKLNNLIKYEWNFHFLLLRHCPVVVPVVWRKMWRMCMRWHLWLKYQRTWIIDRLISFEVKASKGLLHHIKASKIKNDFELFASYFPWIILDSLEE